MDSDNVMKGPPTADDLEQKLLVEPWTLEMAWHFTATRGVAVRAGFGASGRMRERISQNALCHWCLFAPDR